MKQSLPTARQFGQSCLTSCFISSKSRSPSEATESKAPKKSISLSDFLNRKIVKTNGKSIKKKQSSFLSVGSGKNESGSKRDGSFVLDEAVFKRFNEPLMKGGNEAGELQSDVGTKDSRKRKNTVGVSSGEDEKFSGEDEKPQDKKYLVVLGDDPKPKPTARATRLPRERPKPFYNHYENGRGWWDEDREGVDSEEVGCNDVWEGMGSTTLGGLEWH